MNVERALLKNPDFQVLRAEELRTLAEAMMERSYLKGAEIIREGASENELFVVLSGQVVLRREDSAVAELGELGPGAVIGLVSILDPGRRSSTCTAGTDVVVAVLPKSAFTALYLASTGFSLRFQYVIARQLARDLDRLSGALRAAIPSGS